MPYVDVLTSRDVVAVLPEETETHDRVIDVLHHAVPGKTYAFITPVPVQDRG
jgi:hypothetical protein